MALAMSMIRASTRVGLAPRVVAPALMGTSKHLAPSAAVATRVTDLSIRTQTTEAKKEGGIGARFALTAEVLVSKIFPAGFGWQAASLVAGNSLGYGADTAAFAVCTGLGDGGAVILGHSLFYGIKNAGANFGGEVKTAVWLGTAAFMAGGGWQPLVNMFHDSMGLAFNPSMFGTGAGCCALFLAGLRLGRMTWFGGADGTFVGDAQLSVSIGGGTACFVGTDVSFPDNWLRPIVGVEDTTPDLVGCVKAGTSTFLGFGVVQAVENVIIPAGSCWTD